MDIRDGSVHCGVLGGKFFHIFTVSMPGHMYKLNCTNTDNKFKKHYNFNIYIYIYIYTHTVYINVNVMSRQLQILRHCQGESEVLRTG